MSATSPTIERPAPTVGQHSDEILGEYGFDSAVIKGLRDRGVVG